MPVVSTTPPSTVDMAPVVAPDACTMEGSGVGVGKGTDGLDNVDENKIMVCDACLCCYNGILCEDCIGCSAKQECICCVHMCCCKAGAPAHCCHCGNSAEHDDICCLLGIGICGWGLRSPRTCCMCQETF